MSIIIISIVIIIIIIIMIVLLTLLLLLRMTSDVCGGFPPSPFTAFVPCVRPGLGLDRYTTQARNQQGTICV